MKHGLSRSSTNLKTTYLTKTYLSQTGENDDQSRSRLAEVENRERESLLTNNNEKL